MKHYLIILFSLISLMGYSQGLEIKGNAVAESDKQPMIGLTVMVKGTTNGTITDFDGNYTLTNVDKNATLVFP